MKEIFLFDVNTYDQLEFFTKTENYDTQVLKSFNQELATRIKDPFSIKETLNDTIEVIIQFESSYIMLTFPKDRITTARNHIFLGWQHIVTAREPQLNANKVQNKLPAPAKNSEQNTIQPLSAGQPQIVATCGRAGELDEKYLQQEFHSRQEKKRPVPHNSREKLHFTPKFTSRELVENSHNNEAVE